VQKILLILIFLFSTLVFSKESFEIKNVRFTLDVDSNWESVLKNAHNLYLLKKPTPDLGSEKPKSVLLVSNTTLSGVTFNERAMRTQVSTYIEGREKYLKGKEATIDRFVPFEIVKKSSGLIFYMVGVDYQIGNDKYFERSMYVNCSNKIFHIKSLDFILTEDVTSAFQLGKSLKCVD
jgi:hypothetical protein